MLTHLCACDCFSSYLPESIESNERLRFFFFFAAVEVAVEFACSEAPADCCASDCFAALHWVRVDGGASGGHRRTRSMALIGLVRVLAVVVFEVGSLSLCAQSQMQTSLCQSLRLCATSSLRFLLPTFTFATRSCSCPSPTQMRQWLGRHLSRSLTTKLLNSQLEQPHHFTSLMSAATQRRDADRQTAPLIGSLL